MPEARGGYLTLVSRMPKVSLNNSMRATLPRLCTFTCGAHRLNSLPEQQRSFFFFFDEISFKMLELISIREKVRKSPGTRRTQGAERFPPCAVLRKSGQLRATHVWFCHPLAILAQMFEQIDSHVFMADYRLVTFVEQVFQLLQTLLFLDED